MKVLFITRKYPPSTGGMERFAYDLSNALATKTVLELVKWTGSGRVATVLIALPYLTLQSLVVLIRGGVDIIHTHDGVLAPMGYVLAKLFRKPYVVVLHGLDITYKNWLFRVVVPGAVRRADRVICISQAAADEAIKRRVPTNKIQVIPLAVHDDLYGKSSRKKLLKQLELAPDSNILLSVGRLEKRKGVTWFIDNVLPDLVKQYPALIYIVIGEGRDRDNIEAAIERQSLKTHVRLLGRVDDKLHAAAYNGADVFVMPNISVAGDMEGFGLVLLEAALCARPVVAADTEGIKDAVADGQNGVLVKAENAAAFQAAISRFLDDKKYAKEFGTQSRQFTLENFQWDKLADRYIEQYEQLIEP